MSDTKDKGNTGGRKPLTVSRGSSGTVKQSFSHGRSKQVIVQTKKRKVVGPGSGQSGGGSKPAAKSPASSGNQPSKLAEAARKLGITEEELVARQKVLLQRREAEAKQKAEKERQEAARERLLSEQERKVQEDKEREEAEARRKAEEEERKAREEAEAKKKKAEPRAPRDDRSASTPAAQPDIPLPEQTQGRSKKSRKGGGDRDFNDGSSSRGRGNDSKRRRGKLTIASALGDDGDRQRSLASVRRARERERERRQSGDEQQEKVSREVTLPETITLQDLAQRMNERVADVVKYMMRQGEMMRANDIVDADTAELIAEEFGHTVKRVSESDVEIGLEGTDDDEKDLKPRAPIVTVMGHVDHGKTSLLDALRETDVVAGEAGGITQHIGAYQVQVKSGDKITFLDTPGHAAFSAMRARGANVTDIVILVVAADDGVMPQTIEAIKHAKAAEAPIIVAVNKCDKPDAQPDNVLTELLQHDIQVEAMGGDVQAIKVSALEKTGLDELNEAISLQAEILELKANPNREADGIVVEAQLDKGRGPVATVLVNRGTLKRGEIVVAGKQWGKVRALINERGQQLKEAGPAVPAEVLGLDGAPEPGDMFNVVDSEARAREITEYRQRMERQKQGVASSRASLESLMNNLKDGVEASELPIVVKGDVQGSVEAITHSLEKISTEEVRANVIYGAAGGISESDILLAKSSGAPVFAFNVRANKQARELAEKEGVEIRYYSVIYNLIDDVKDTLSGMLAPEKRENFIGYADILEVFNITKAGKVAGCKVTEGVVKRGCGVRLLRDDVVIHEGKLKTLKRFKDEVAEVTSGMECGMAFEKYEDIREGDKIECFEVEMIERQLD
ncbi:translation initiation factor IF-2 [Henriciella sp. AS95]|uniref:translation initiation factor IF-2 n=1 Tax=Henriciella sp. AS95 TaxID=3135782 RepID=UPI00317C8315